MKDINPTALKDLDVRNKNDQITFGRICKINAIYNIFPDGDSNPIPQNSSQADKYLTNMAVNDPLMTL